jgi:hypothetical protein
MKDYEGDEVVKDAGFGSIALTYDYSQRWTFEGVVSFYPQLLGGERDLWAGSVHVGVTNRLLEIAGVEKTSAIGLSLECLYHLTRWDRLDPYFVVGAGVMFYEHDVGEGTTDPTANAGLGVLYHFNDRLAIRADARAFIVGTSAFEANSLINVGIVWTLGTRAH